MKAYVFFVFLLVNGLVYGQDTNALQTAFKESYTLESTGNYDEAIDQLIASYDPQSYETNLRLGWLQYLKGNLPESKKYYLQAIQLMPYAFEPKLGYVYPLAAMGNWDEVMKLYKEILKIDPQNTLVNYRVAVIYYERMEYEKAYGHAEKVVNLYPFDYDSVILFAWINLKMEKYREAKVLFNKSLLIQPESASALEGMKLLK
jgi:tetratricopeptide (TPR) repeat protein